MRRSPGMGTTTPTVRDGTLYTADHWTGTRVGSDKWFEWLADTRTFTYRSYIGTFIARRETKPSGGAYWIAQCTVDNVLRQTYLGVTASLTEDRLDNAARRLNIG